ncbi:SH2 domain-containing protein 2A isoform X3 [Peromyscus californicus insignis]|uniref:SH2 domain-containing protein 2A isoform X3 n=1 Tax=Peromyscus californicus insignis TaxID=564181 RepID=UPI0022A7E85A|nr:SH2 domain-containing protein 2A isoform X3 [Peromyscus californicus insignis]
MEFCLAQTCPQGNHEAPSPTFSTFQPMNLTQGRCQDLNLGSKPSMQAVTEQEVQLSPRATHTVASASAPGAAWVLGNADKEEEVPGKGGLSLQAETRAWVQKTQSHWLLLRTAPVWFHGFITRREAERLLQPQPQGCYLVRFSESTVTFVLSYRSRTCCRHFLLAQLGDGRHVVLGEDSAHAQLQDLLQHYTEFPLSPYGETLTQPLARQTAEPAGLSLRTESDSGSKRQEDPDSQHKLLIQQGQAQAPAHKEGVWASQAKETSQGSRPRPPIPAKPQLPLEVYTRPTSRPHRALPVHPIYQEPDEPIAFYAMGRGSPGEAPSNIYAEVEGPSGMAPTGHPTLQKCWSRPISGGQAKGVQGKKSSRRPAERGSPS